MKVGSQEISAEKKHFRFEIFIRKESHFLLMATKELKTETVCKQRSLLLSRKKIVYAEATEDASIFLLKFEGVHESLQKEVVWTSAYFS